MNAAASQAFRDELWSLLGYPEGLPELTDSRTTSSQTLDGCCIDQIHLTIDGCSVPGTLLRPLNSSVQHPAVLYCHAHGHRYDIGRQELMEGRAAIAQPPYGYTLVKRGYVVLCIDMPTFGERQHECEDALSKAHLWRGTTQFGQMLAELSVALGYLLDQEDVDSLRVATLGLSMGATHAYWLAALNTRVTATAHLCAFASLRRLIGSGAHNLHGHYMTVPGLLAHCDTTDIAALIAPRPQLICAGESDPLTPPDALIDAVSSIENAYLDKRATENFNYFAAQNSGHVETPQMRQRVLSFLSTVFDPEDGHPAES